MKTGDVIDTDATSKLPRKKLNILWWLGGLVLLLLLLFLLQLFGPDPAIIVSPQTTYITEPRKSNGLPDYEQHVLDADRNGITPQNNAAVLMWQAMWHSGELEASQFGPMAAELGLTQIPSKDDSLVRLYGKVVQSRLNEWLQSQGRTGDTDATYDGAKADSQAELVEELIEQATSRPWTSAQIPPLAQWISENKKPLDLLLAASLRPRYYSPSPTLLDRKSDLLMSMAMPGVMGMRDAGRSLSARAMWNLGEGRPMDSWQDILAMHRLAHLLTQGRMLIEQLVGLVLHRFACERTQTLVQHGELTVDQLRQIRADLDSMPNFAVVVNAIDTGERMMAIDAFVQFAESPNDADLSLALGLDRNLTDSGALHAVSIDWNLVLREVNRWYDRLAAAARIKDRATRTAAIAKFDADVKLVVAKNRGPAAIAKAIVSRRQRSDWVGAILAGQFLPSVKQAFTVEDRANTDQQLTRLAVALAQYRAVHGAYPAKLDDLVPGNLDQLPVDIYNAKAFLYKRADDGYLLYSAGENGADDGGSMDDASIRAPQPVFELPTVPADGRP